MKKSGKVHHCLKAVTGMLMLLLVLSAGVGAFSITARADSAGKITATSAKIRKEPSTSSETLASLEQNAVVSIKGQTKGSDGYTWYQVDDANMTGYIRSDLVSITDGSTPAALGGSSSAPATGSSTPTTSTPDETLVQVTEVEPVSGSVTGGSPVRVRQNASTTSRIVHTVQSGQSLTVTGMATGTDGNEWRLVNLTSGSQEISGFIRADYISVSGELVPKGAETEEPGEQAPETPEQPAEEPKDWDTVFQDGKWHLTDNINGNSYDIQEIFDSVEANTKTLNDVAKSNKTYQVAVIILCIILVAMAAAVSFLVFKLREMADAEYFNEVERETMRRRTAGGSGTGRPSGAGAQRPAGQRSSGGNGQRPAGQRPTGGNGQRPAGQRPTGGNAQQRPSGAGAQPRPAGQRPSGAGAQPRPAGQRPSGAGPQQRTAGQRPTGASPQPRPAGQRPADPGRSRPERPQEYDQEIGENRHSQERDYDPAGERAAQRKGEDPKVSAQPREKDGWKSKNFVDDDEFEFQFLDWDSDEQK